MKKLKVYLAGKVNPNSSFGTQDWRDSFCQQLSEKTGLDIVNLDPTKSNGEFELDQNNSSLIVGRNSFLEKNADVVIVYLSDDISVGGSQEMLIAKYFHKLLIGIAPKEGKFNKSVKQSLGKTYKNYIDPYVKSSCDKIVEDIDQLASFLKEYSQEQNLPAKDLSYLDEMIGDYEKEYLDQDELVKNRIKN